MIDFSFMLGGNPEQGQQMKQFQQAGAQPAEKGPISLIPQGAVTTQNAGGIADALMSNAADPVSTGNSNAGGMMDKFGGKSGVSYILASLGQALSARDPNSWQFQLSSMMKQGAGNQMQQRGSLIAALQQKISAPGKPGVGDFSAKNSKMKLSLLPTGGGLNTSGIAPENLYSSILGQVK